MTPKKNLKAFPNPVGNPKSSDDKWCTGHGAFVAPNLMATYSYKGVVQHRSVCKDCWNTYHSQYRKGETQESSVKRANRFTLAEESLHLVSSLNALTGAVQDLSSALGAESAHDRKGYMRQAQGRLQEASEPLISLYSALADRVAAHEAAKVRVPRAVRSTIPDSDYQDHAARLADQALAHELDRTLAPSAPATQEGVAPDAAPLVPPPAPPTQEAVKRGPVTLNGVTYPHSDYAAVKDEKGEHLYVQCKGWAPCTAPLPLYNEHGWPSFLRNPTAQEYQSMTREQKKSISDAVLGWNLNVERDYLPDMRDDDDYM